VRISITRSESLDDRLFVHEQYVKEKAIIERLGLASKT